jgi:hypothetical protein
MVALVLQDINMEVKVLEEHGYESALLGLSLSFYDHKEELSTWWDEDKKLRAVRRASALAFKGGGHNKFLESIQVWIYIKATRSFWSEFDTYRIGITKNSSSTMHTLDKRYVTKEDFEEGTSIHMVNLFNSMLDDYKDTKSKYYKDITRLKANLPEGWSQERQVCVNYMTLQNILRQRTGHRLHYWDTFKNTILAQVEHPELLIQGD